MNIWKPVLVWHGHHQEESPLEELNQSFRSRKNTITYQKSTRETPREIAIRKKLFKHVKGGLKALPVSFQKAYESYVTLHKKAIKVQTHYKKTGDGWEAFVEARDAAYVALDDFGEMLKKPTKAILKLHKEQCGCGWKPWPDNDILRYYTGKV